MLRNKNYSKTWPAACVLLFSFYFILFFGTKAIAQSDPKAILEKSYVKCVSLQGGQYKSEISKRSFNDSLSATSTAECRFTRVEGDSASPFKFFVSMHDGDGTLCTSNDLVQLNGSDSTGIIYSRSNNQSMFRGAFQSEGLFPPFFQPQVVFSLDRMEQTTFIVRMGKDTEVNGNACYTIRLIDLIRATLPDGQRQEKTFLIDKKTFLPLSYSEKSVMKLNADSAYKENSYRLTSLSSEPLHDSLFTYRNIPSHFQLRNMLEHVYHHHLEPGMTAPLFTGKVLESDSITLKSLTGKKVLLFFFYRASYPSLKALSGLQEFQNSNPDVQVLLIGIDASERDLKTLLSKRNISLKAIEDGQPIAEKYFITAAPSFVLIDEKGIILKIKNGYREGMAISLLH